MDDYKLSYTAVEIDEKLGNVDKCMENMGDVQEQCVLLDLPQAVNGRIDSYYSKVGSGLQMASGGSWYYVEIPVLGGYRYKVKSHTTSDQTALYAVTVDKNNIILASYIEPTPNEPYGIPVEVEFTAPTNAVKLVLCTFSGNDSTVFYARVAVWETSKLSLQEQIDRLSKNAELTDAKIGINPDQWISLKLPAAVSGRIDDYFSKVGSELVMSASATWYHVELPIIGGNKYRVKNYTTQSIYFPYAVTVDENNIVLASYIEPTPNGQGPVEVEFTAPDTAVKLILCTYSGADTTLFYERVAAWEHTFVPLQEQINSLKDAASESLKFMSVSEFNTLDTDSMNVSDAIVLY